MNGSQMLSFACGIIAQKVVGRAQRVKSLNHLEGIRHVFQRAWHAQLLGHGSLEPAIPVALLDRYTPIPRQYYNVHVTRHFPDAACHECVSAGRRERPYSWKRTQ